ncbi:MAG: hypothetical protein R3B55_01235 [Candidatus Paceibacterota bacterium]
MECHWSIIPEGNKDIVDPIKELSCMKFGRPRDEVEGEVMEKFESFRKIFYKKPEKGFLICSYFFHDKKVTKTLDPHFTPKTKII